MVVPRADWTGNMMFDEGGALQFYGSGPTI